MLHIAQHSPVCLIPLYGKLWASFLHDLIDKQCPIPRQLHAVVCKLLSAKLQPIEQLCHRCGRIIRQLQEISAAQTVILFLPAIALQHLRKFLPAKCIRQNGKLQQPVCHRHAYLCLRRAQQMMRLNTVRRIDLSLLLQLTDPGTEQLIHPILLGCREAEKPPFSVLIWEITACHLEHLPLPQQIPPAIWLLLKQIVLIFSICALCAQCDIAIFLIQIKSKHSFLWTVFLQ